MGRPETTGGATTIDSVGVEEGELNNGTETETRQETNDSVDVEAGDGDSLRGPKDPEAGEDAGEEEGAVETETNDAESEPTEFEALTSKIEELEKRLTQLNYQPPAQHEQQKPVELSEEEWAKQEETWGVPRSTIKAATAQNMKVYDTLRNYVDQRFAKFDKADALRSLSQEKDFSDAMRFPKDVDEYLNDYDPRTWSDQGLLKKAVIYARGKNLKSTVSKVRSENERNKKIAGTGRPAGGSPGMAKPAAKPLTAMQRDVASKFGMSESEYQKLKGGSRRIAN